MNESICTINENGDKIWRNSAGQYHRIDGPAIECANGDKVWYVNGKRHRTDGPAVENADGGKWRYFNNKLHRTDGLAVQLADGTKEYWYKGEQITEEVFYSDEFQVRMVMEL